MAITGVEVTGLKEAGKNFATLNGLVKTTIGRDSLREAAWVLARPMRRATYTTGFKRITGAIKAGLGVTIQKGVNEQGQLTGYVEEYPQKISGTNPSAFALKMRARAARKTRRKIDISQIAFYWRFLEFGTGPRHTGVSTPIFLRTGRIAQNPKRQQRQLKSAQRWQAAPSGGGIKAKSWIRPIFGSTAPNAIASFDVTIKRLIATAVDAMPK